MCVQINTFKGTKVGIKTRKLIVREANSSLLYLYDSCPVPLHFCTAALLHRCTSAPLHCVVHLRQSSSNIPRMDSSISSSDPWSDPEPSSSASCVILVLEVFFSSVAPCPCSVNLISHDLLRPASREVVATESGISMAPWSKTCSEIFLCPLTKQ